MVACAQFRGLAGEEKMKVRGAKIMAAAALGLMMAIGVTVSAATLVVDTNNPDCEGGVPNSPTIQGAVTAASSDDTIDVCPGTYSEQVTISGKTLMLQSVGVGAVLSEGTAIIQAPNTTLTGNAAIVDISGAANVTIQDFMIEGPGPGSCGSIADGIFVEDGSNAVIEDNSVIDIADNPMSGCQNGIAIRVGKTNFGNGTATIDGNTISGYQKGGIVIDLAGSNAVITGNIVTGAGKTQANGQNGIEVARGATATLTGNTVTGNFYSNAIASGPTCPSPTDPSSSVGNCLVTATGVLFVGAGSNGDEGQLNSQNTLRHNQTNVVIIP
jgi:nitrous oxidase accessory protein NosD